MAERKSPHNLEEFLDKYTLHDSFWVGLFHHVAFDRSVTLAFQWDSVWLPQLIQATHNFAYCSTRDTVEVGGFSPVAVQYK